jgi:hypothetical protein
MEQTITVKVDMEFNGTHWVLYVNSVPLRMKFSDKKTATLIYGVIRSVLPDIAEAISMELEK